MNGAHDLGGMHGFGAVESEADEPVFHTDWERRAFALTLAMGAWRRWNIDMSRSEREQMPPAEYLATTYYEHWLFGLERLLRQHGFVDDEELARVVRGEVSSSTGAPVLQEGALRRENVQRMLRNPRASRLEDAAPAKFRVGQAVVARNMHPVGHTRVPRYVRGRRGEVAMDHGVFIFPDTHATGEGKKPQHVYAVRFAAQELWGAGAPQRDSVYVDLWDDYLEAA